MRRPADAREGQSGALVVLKRSMVARMDDAKKGGQKPDQEESDMSFLEVDRGLPWLSSG